MQVSLSPVVSLILNTLLAAVSGVASTQVTDASGAKSTLIGVAGAALLNAILHAVSSATAGPLATTPPK